MTNTTSSAADFKPNKLISAAGDDVSADFVEGNEVAFAEFEVGVWIVAMCVLLAESDFERFCWAQPNDIIAKTTTAETFDKFFMFRNFLFVQIDRARIYFSNASPHIGNVFVFIRITAIAAAIINPIPPILPIQLYGDGRLLINRHRSGR